MRGKKVKWDVGTGLRGVVRWRCICVKGGVRMKEWKQG